MLNCIKLLQLHPRENLIEKGVLILADLKLHDVRLTLDLEVLAAEGNHHLTESLIERLLLQVGYLNEDAHRGVLIRNAFVQTEENVEVDEIERDEDAGDEKDKE